MSVCMYVFVLPRSHACMCVSKCVCVCASMFGVCVVRVCVCVYVWRSCVFVCVCIGQTSSVRLRIQSWPDGADSHFLRWLTAVHVNSNNICIGFIPLRNNFSITVLRKTEMTNLFLFFGFFKSTVEWINERILQHISAVKTQESSPRVSSPAVDGN